MKLKLLFTSLMIIVSGFATGQEEKPIRTNVNDSTPEKKVFKQEGKPLRAKVNISNPEIKSFYDAAVSVSSQEGRTMAELKKKEKLATTNCERLYYSWADIVLKRGYTIAKEVKKTKGNISTAQYTEFQRKLQENEVELDKIVESGTSAYGDPAPGTLGECWKSCDDAVGSGFGKGKGLNRFACKAGCIITKLPPGN